MILSRKMQSWKNGLIFVNRSDVNQASRLLDVLKERRSILFGDDIQTAWRDQEGEYILFNSRSRGAEFHKVVRH